MKPVLLDEAIGNATIVRKPNALFRQNALKQAAPELFAQAPLEAWKTRWVVDIRPAGSGKTALKYPAPYIFRVAICNKRIVSFKDGLVTSRYQDNNDTWHCETLTAEAFTPLDNYMMSFSCSFAVELIQRGEWLVFSNTFCPGALSKCTTPAA